MKSCSYVDNICVYGDARNANIVALVQPNRISIDKLANQLGKPDIKYEKILADNEIESIVTKTIREHGFQAKLSKNSIPTRIKLCAEEWTPTSGLVTAALKIKRKNVEKFYWKDIEAMYSRYNYGSINNNPSN